MHGVHPYGEYTPYGYAPFLAWRTEDCGDTKIKKQHFMYPVITQLLFMHTKCNTMGIKNDQDVKRI